MKDATIPEGKKLDEDGNAQLEPTVIAVKVRMRGRVGSKTLSLSSEPCATIYATEADTPENNRPKSGGTKGLEQQAPQQSAKAVSTSLPVMRITMAIQRFRRVWVQTWMDLCQGRRPDSEPIERARADLMQALADHPVGSRVPLLNRHLSIYTKEFIVALQTSTLSVSAIMQMRSRYTHGYEDALIQAEAAIAGSEGRQGAIRKS